MPWGRKCAPAPSAPLPPTRSPLPSHLLTHTLPGLFAQSLWLLHSLLCVSVLSQSPGQPGACAVQERRRLCPFRGGCAVSWPCRAGRHLKDEKMEVGGDGGVNPRQWGKCGHRGEAGKYQGPSRRCGIVGFAQGGGQWSEVKSGQVGRANCRSPP